MTLGVAITAIRYDLNETQEKFGSRIGVVQATVVRYESDKQIPNARILGKILKVSSNKPHLKDCREIIRQAFEERMSQCRPLRLVGRLPLTSQNQPTLDLFTAYCKEHPYERFWQALRNWSGKEAILAKYDGRTEDTFYWEDVKPPE